MSRGPDAGTLLSRVLAEAAARAGCPFELVSADSTRWASATFAGARHALALSANATPALDNWLAELPEAEFAMRGHVVADLTVETIRRAGSITFANIEVLTVEDR